MRVLWIVVLLASAWPARAESVRPERAISLRSAIDLAIRRNPTLAAAVADVDAARGAATAARGLDDVLLDGRASWLETRQQLLAGSPLQQPSFDDVAGSVSLTKPLATGGRIGLVLSNEYNRTDFVTPNGANAGQLDRQTSTVYAPSLQLTLQHPLLRGLGVGV